MAYLYERNFMSCEKTIDTLCYVDYVKPLVQATCFKHVNSLRTSRQIYCPVV